MLDTATGALHRLTGVGRPLPNPHLRISPYVRIKADDEQSVAELHDDVVEVPNLAP